MFENPSYLTNVILLFLVLFVTTTTGAPLIFNYVKRGRFLSKLALSFVTGYSILSLSTIPFHLAGFDPFYIQVVIVVAGLILTWHPRTRNSIKILLPDYSNVRSRADSETDNCADTIPLYNRIFTRYLFRFGDHYDKTDLIVICLFFLYIGILTAFFTQIIMWMAGDAVAHSTVIRMLLDQTNVPLSIAPFGSHWEYYPKGFHFYTYPFAKVFSLLSAVEVIPVILSAITPMLLYSVVRECKKRELALLVFILACFCFPQHYSYLIWAGYPSIAGEMLMVASILAIILEWRLLFLLIPSLIFSHTRFLFYTIVALVGWWIVEVATSKHHVITNKIRSVITDKTTIFLIVLLLLSLMGAWLVVFIFPHLFYVHGYILSSQDSLNKFLLQWCWGLFSIFGIAIAWYNHNNKITKLAFGWFFGLLFVFIFIDASIIPNIISTSGGRILSKLYIPLSIFAGIAIFSIIHWASHCDSSSRYIPKLKYLIVILVIAMGVFSMTYVFVSYGDKWSLPEEDYNSLMWLNNQSIENAVVLNLDATGGWVYPLSGIPVGNPLMGESPHICSENNWDTIISQMRDRPDNPVLIESLKNVSQNYNQIIIFISSTALSNPNYKPPFTNFYGTAYQNVNNSYPVALYAKLYSNKTQIYRLT